MTNPLISDALKEAYASCSDEFEVYETVELSIGSLIAYYCSGLTPRTSKDENGITVNWNPAPFKISLPQQSTTGISALSLTIENTDGIAMKIVNAIRKGSSVAYLKYRTYIEGQDSPQNPRPMKFEIQSAACTLGSITFQAGIPDIVNKSYPNAFYSYTSFPGLRS